MASQSIERFNPKSQGSRHDLTRSDPNSLSRLCFVLLLQPLPQWIMSHNCVDSTVCQQSAFVDQPMITSWCGIPEPPSGREVSTGQPLESTGGHPTIRIPGRRSRPEQSETGGIRGIVSAPKAVRTASGLNNDGDAVGHFT